MSKDAAMLPEMFWKVLLNFASKSMLEKHAQPTTND